VTVGWGYLFKTALKEFNPALLEYTKIDIPPSPKKITTPGIGHLIKEALRAFNPGLVFSKPSATTNTEEAATGRKFSSVDDEDAQEKNRVNQMKFMLSGGPNESPPPTKRRPAPEVGNAINGRWE
jgi:hypothetical protein